LRIANFRNLGIKEFEALGFLVLTPQLITSPFFVICFSYDHYSQPMSAHKPYFVLKL
jgi:hypothetical protein